MSEELKRMIKEDPRVRDMIFEMCSAIQKAVPAAKIMPSESNIFDDLLNKFQQ